MGFQESEVRQAIDATNNSGIDNAMNWILENRAKEQNPPTQSIPLTGLPNLAQLASLFSPPSRVKMVLVVRTDLKMGVGKIAAQCGHAAVGLYQDLAHSKVPRERQLLRQWEESASPKIAVKVPSYEEMMKLESKASEPPLNLPTHVVLDAGRTQVAPGSATVLAILGPTNEVDQVTGHLKLL